MQAERFFARIKQARKISEIRNMKKKVLNYRIIIQPDKRTGTEKACYSVYCPTLGLADEGETVEEAVSNMKKLIKFHLESLVKEKEEIPQEEPDKDFMTTAKIEFSRGHFSFA